MVGAGASISGGWQSDMTSVGVNGAPAAGVVFGSRSGGSTLINDGTIGALSDRAVFGDALIINNGIITGFLQLTGVNDVSNNGIFDLRNFADTNGDGIRDTLSVAVSDLGSGPSTFTNNGTLALPGSPGAMSLNSTGQYLPLGLTFNSMALGGPVQGQIFGATTFTNSGTIDLQANPVPGDVLLISGGHTPGTSGDGTFIANGGQLLLDTVLNEGGANSRSDVLVVDGTAVGPGGATRLFAQNAGGAGALTVNNGILVVQVLDSSRSPGGVFALGAPALAGPYEYTLFLGGVGADATNGNWYLRSTINCALAPTDPQCVTPPGVTPPQLVPNFRPQTSLYAAIPSMTLIYGRTLLDTLHERVGDEEDLVGEPRLDSTASGGWGRIIGEHGNVNNGDPLGVLGQGPTFDYNIAAFQVGQDLYRRDGLDGSRDHAGLYGAMGQLSGSVTHLDGTDAGTDQFLAYTAGGYWTHFGPSGWYLDAIMQETRYDAQGVSNVLPVLTTNGWGFAGSLESGYPIKFGSFIVEPQAQAVYQNIALSDGNDTAATVQFRNIDSFAARFGARFANTWNFDEAYRPAQIIAWLRPSVWHEFLGDSQTLFSSATGPVPFQSDLGGTWVEFTAGVDAKITNAATLFANVSYETGTAPHGDSYAYNGKVGLRIAW
jgi:autotransporter family porin